MEKTAIAVPVHEPKHDRQPPLLCISGIVFALGLVEGDGEGAGIAPCIEVPWPPHPATAAHAANAKITRLERNTFFKFAILGNFLRRQSCSRVTFLWSLSRYRVGAGFISGRTSGLSRNAYYRDF
jgi:hypothetical protein